MFFTKVDRVQSCEEAISLESLGVKFIGVSIIDDDLRFNDCREVCNLKALNIRKSLTEAMFVLEIPLDETDEGLIDIVDMVKPDYVQLSVPYFSNKFPSLNFINYLKNIGIGIIYSDINVTFDDDISLLMKIYEDYAEINTSFFQINLYGDIKKSWNLLRQQVGSSSNSNEWLGISDIIDLGKEYPIIISLDFDTENVFEIISTFSSIKGVSLCLSERLSKNDLHCFNYESALQILKTLGDLDFLDGLDVQKNISK